MNVSDGAQFVVAAATLLLALGTFLMARETRNVAQQTRAEAEAIANEVEVAREQVAATNRQAAAATAALAASIQPWLTKAPERTFEGSSVWIQEPVVGVRDGEIVVSFLLRNAGRGIALVREAVLHARGRSSADVEPLPYRAFFGTPVLQPNDDTNVVFHWSAQGPSPDEEFGELVGRPGIWGELFVDVAYTDASGGQHTSARVHLTATSGTGEDWTVHAIGYRRPDEEEPFAHVEFLS